MNPINMININPMNIKMNMDLIKYGQNMDIHMIREKLINNINIMKMNKMIIYKILEI